MVSIAAQMFGITDFKGITWELRMKDYVLLSRSPQSAILLKLQMNEEEKSS